MNIRNLVAIAIIIVVAPLIMATMASAEPIRGQYISTGEGLCIVAPLGFKPDLTPSCTQTPQGTTVCPGILQLYVGEGVFSFNSDGTGTLNSVIQWVVQSFQGPSGTVPPSAGTQKLSLKFHYNVTNEGKITITSDPGTYTAEWISGPNAKKIFHFNGWVRKGTVAPGGKMIMLTSDVSDVVSIIAPYEGMAPTTQVVCNGSHVLIWQRD